VTQRRKSIDLLVASFAEDVAAQTASIWAGDARTGNRHAKRYLKAYRQLRDMGDEGLEALSRLFQHDSPDVRSMAAVFLLKYKTEEALAILRLIAQRPGLVGFGASEAIKRWEEGAWHLDD
jgi:hypothetical protein